jgi:hypothetical protein
MRATGSRSNPSDQKQKGGHKARPYDARSAVRDRRYKAIANRKSPIGNRQ